MKMWNNALHIHIDIETLATSPDAVITEIGVAWTYVNERLHAPDLIKAQQLDIMPFAEQNRSRIIDEETFEWHMSQARKVKGSKKGLPRFLDPTFNGHILGTALHKLMTTVRGAITHTANKTGEAQPRVFFWCYSNTFDIGILNHAYDQIGLSPPWKPYYRWLEELRTLLHIHEHLTGDYHKDVLERNRIGKHHCAIDDAETQLRTMLDVFNTLSTYKQHEE